MTLTLCLDCGARRSGIGGSNCLACGSMALELRRGHAFSRVGPTRLGLEICEHCGVFPPARAQGSEWWGVDGLFGRAHLEPDCLTTSALCEQNNRE